MSYALLPVVGFLPIIMINMIFLDLVTGVKVDNSASAKMVGVKKLSIMS